MFFKFHSLNSTFTQNITHKIFPDIPVYLQGHLEDQMFSNILNLKLSSHLSGMHFPLISTTNGVGENSRKSAKIPRASALLLHRSKSKCELCHHRAMRLEVSEPQLLHHKTEDNNNALITGVLKGLGKDDKCYF